MKRVLLSSFALILTGLVFSIPELVASTPVLTSLNVSPGTTTISGVDTTRQFTAIGTFSDGSVRPLNNSDAWAPAGSLVTGRFYHTATLLQDGSVLVTGGVAGGSSSLATAERYLPWSGSWVSAQSMTLPRAAHTATILPNGKVLVAGGMNFATNQVYNSTEIYDPASNSWSFGPAMIDPENGGIRAFHNAVALANGKVLISVGVKGWPDCVYRRTAELYDPGTNSFSMTGSLALNRSNAAATLLANGKVLLINGPQNNCPTPNVGLSEAEVYDPVTGVWTVTALPTINRYNNFIASLPDGRALIAGGNGVGGATASAELFIPGPNIFVGTSSMTLARSTSGGTGDNGSTVVLGNGKVLIAGGQNAFAGQVFSSATLFNPATGTWSPAASMATARAHNTTTLLNDGRVLIVGGSTQTGAPLASAELYKPADDVLWSSSNPGVAAIDANGKATAGFDGTTTITATAGSFTKTASLKVDRTAPTLGLPNNLTVPATGPGGAMVTFVAEGNDATDGPVPAFCNPPSGSFFPIGTTTVSCTASDNSGNETHGTFDVTVELVDTQAPVSNHIVPPANGFGWYNTAVNVTINANDFGSPASGVQSITYALQGAQGGSATVSGNSASFTVTNEGQTSVQYFATDNAGNIEFSHFFVVQIDRTAPPATLTAPPPNANGWNRFQPNVQISSNQSPNGSPIQSISYSLIGAQSGAFTVQGSSTSFDIFNQGDTTIQYHATDQAGNSGADQSYLVRYDSTPPLVDFISNITTNATSSLGAVVTYPINATDGTSGIDTITSTMPSGSTFPHGSTNVNVTVTDKAGNITTRSFTVTVNKTLVSIAVNPATASINEGQSQSFTAQGTFTDGTQQTLPTGSGGGGGGGGGNFGSGSVWNVHFDTPLSLSQCTGNSLSSFSSQAIGVTTALPASIDVPWGPTNSVVRATGSLTTTQLSLTLACINGQGSSGSLNATWTGTRYEGTWNFSGTSGNVTVRGWSPKASAPTPRFSIGAATVNNIVYVMGRDNPSLPSPVEAYDIATNMWSTVGAMPTSREGAAYAVLNGMIYAAGGHISGGGATATVDVYNPSTNSWVSIAPMNTMRAQFALVAASNGRLYAIGGEMGSSGAPSTASVEAYDPATNTWTPQASMFTPRKFHVAGAIGSTIVVAGGNSGGSSTTEIYNVTSNSWTNGASPTSNVEGGRAAVINGAMFVVGGTSNGGSARVQMYRPAVGGSNPSPAGWAVPGDMPTGRGQLAVAAAGGSSDVLFAVGGLRNGSSMSTVEALSTPPPNDLNVTSGGSGGGGGGSTTPTVTFTSSNTNVATMNLGLAMGNHAGETNIIATAAGVSCETTNTCAKLTVVNPECATIVIHVVPTGAFPFSALPTTIEGEGSFDLPFGTNKFETEPGTYILHFTPPAGYTALPNPLTINASCSSTVDVEVVVDAVDSTPPALTLPANITTYATSPLGANVSFTASAVDAIDGARPVSCSPISGSLFPIGVTSVQCSASDTHGNTANGTFTVTVLSAAQIVGDLIDEIDNFQQASGLLNNVLKSLTNGNTGAACNQIGAFINQVQAQTGKKLTQAEAAQLLQIANAAKAALGCP